MVDDTTIVGYVWKTAIKMTGDLTKRSKEDIPTLTKSNASHTTNTMKADLLALPRLAAPQITHQNSSNTKRNLKQLIKRIYMESTNKT